MERVYPVTLICILLQIKHDSNWLKTICFFKRILKFHLVLKKQKNWQVECGCLAQWSSCFQFLVVVFAKTFLKKWFVEEWCKLEAKVFVFVFCLFTKATSGKLIVVEQECYCCGCGCVESVTSVTIFWQLIKPSAVIASCLCSSKILIFSKQTNKRMLAKWVREMVYIKKWARRKKEDLQASTQQENWEELKRRG